MEGQAVRTFINGRWPLYLPEHRAMRPEWAWWEAGRLAAMHHFLRPEDVVWDIGAEEGDLSGLYASWGCKVFLAEPNDRVWPNIKRVWTANRLRKPVATWVGFIGDEISGESALQFAWPDCASGPLIGDHGFCQLGERPDIPMITVDALVERGVEPPSALTIDVEGSELHVLTGASQTLREFRPLIFISIHPEFMQHHYAIADGVETICAYLDGHEYDKQFIAIDHEHHWMFKPR